jgi:Domain of unknown function (DUF4440)
MTSHASPCRRNRRNRRRRRAVLGIASGAVLVGTLTAGLGGCSSGRSSGSSATASAAEVRALEVTRLKALVAADLPILRRIHANDFELVTADGSVLTKSGALDAVGTGDLDYLTFSPVSEIRVRVHGDSAMVRYKSRIDVRSVDTGRVTHYAWHTDLYERREGRWQVVWSQATPVGRLPDPTTT